MTAAAGVFAHWQPAYAERGLITFPCRDDKVPAVAGYLKLGSRTSASLAAKFPRHNAIGLACRRNRITVLDVDCPDERILADAMDELGPTPFVVRSGSGNFQAWYRHGGERRRVRPDPLRPIDILGDGFVVAPPSVGAKGAYQIISGSLDDLDRLPAMRRPTPAGTPANDLEAQSAAAPLIEPGRRNEALWRWCMTEARRCETAADLFDAATIANRTMMADPLPDAEVRKVAANAWAKEAAGENWFGLGGRVVIAADEIDGLMIENPDAFLLLTMLRRHHWSRSFVMANAMAESMPGGGWHRKRFAAARTYLRDAGYVAEIRPASRQHGPAVYQFKGGQF